MKRIYFLAFVFLVCGQLPALAQQNDTLPNFSVHALTKNKNQISWINPYPDCNQLVVQRSYDSLKFFTSIFSAQSPELVQNGFVDNQFTPGVTVYYRIFYVQQGGKYFFTASKSADNLRVMADAQKNNQILLPGQPLQNNETIIMFRIFNKERDSLLYMLEPKDYRHFKDSITTKTKDTLSIVAENEIILKRYIPKMVWKPSIFVFTNNKGYVTIALPNTKIHDYSVKFFNDKNEFVFQMNGIKDPYLVVDKSNFLHAGWFYFELYEDHHLQEKNKFYIEKDF
ncbi:MAG: hypothetical protein K2W79_12265 [Hydrotalea flava]|uniref:hypothetical protein n=1 Tax=Hydrotalea TaxID=1004300 RepID=UPI0010269AF7|nr:MULTISPECIES: hypothetical protein [Hydrotalea]MBY0349026.1 hypothetical protein [Hydrotalea flava]RWZ90275.1 MAG: hypothetical protein EO766_02370 [Hydrotalea sp. AMD]